MTCAMFYNFDLASVIRITGGTYTTSHLNVDSILQTLENVGPQDEIYQHIKHLVTIGYPVYFNAESSNEIVKPFLEHGNHHSITQYIATVTKTMTKEYRYCYFIPFPRWITRLYPIFISHHKVFFSSLRKTKNDLE